jgi:hypothetical protein
MSFPLPPEFSVHPTEELLEEYRFARVCEPALEILEAHLLVCVPCQNKLEEVDTCIDLIKIAARVLEQDRAWEREQELSNAKPSSWMRILPGRRAFLGTTLAAGLACIMLLGGRTFSQTKPAIPRAVRLVAMRGGEIDGLAPAHSGGPLELIVDSNTLPPKAGYRLEMVNQSGHEIWSGVPAVAGTTLSAHITESPRPGVYWIRLYSSRGELLREFGMRVE